jgi:formyltetrahydrofolate deformylase
LISHAGLLRCGGSIHHFGTAAARPHWVISIMPAWHGTTCDNSPSMNHAYILTLSCPDRMGIVHAVSGFLLQNGGNIEEAAQYNDPATGLFFMRVQFACDQLSHDELRSQLTVFAEPFGMNWKLHATTQPMRTVILVSKEGHCLNDLLFRCKSGLLPIDVRAIVSNHREFYQLAASYNIPFHHLPVTSATKAQVEAKQLEIIESENAELVVLARYMQILSNDLCRQLAGRAINIHHSFLPSFKGAKPYYQAHDRGVKLIGATAHYVTADLDEGPIIEQDVARADHSKTVEDLTAMGRDTESQVLARAVKWHSEHRVLLNGHKTVIFK